MDALITCSRLTDFLHCRTVLVTILCQAQCFAKSKKWPHTNQEGRSRIKCKFCLDFCRYCRSRKMRSANYHWTYFQTLCILFLHINLQKVKMTGSRATFQIVFWHKQKVSGVNKNLWRFPNLICFSNRLLKANHTREMVFIGELYFKTCIRQSKTCIGM
jgi:hypothetical protein